MVTEIFSGVFTSQSFISPGVYTIALAGLIFNIIFLMLIFLLFRKRVRMYHKTRNKYDVAHTSVKELNFSDHEEKDEELDAPELLFYKASHDLKGPLKSIRGLVQLALKDDKKENQTLYLEKINETTTSLEDFLEEILNLGRIKKQRARKKEIDIKEFVNSIIQGFESYPGRNRLEININIKAGIIIKSDDSLLKSVFQNLIENAIKYSDERKAFSELLIKGTITNNHLYISFSDNGLGISSEHLPYVFDLFYRVDSIKEGSGLGLYIVKEAVKKLNGKIKALSRIGVGSEFIVEIPLTEEIGNISLETNDKFAKKSGESLH